MYSIGISPVQVLSCLKKLYICYHSAKDEDEADYSKIVCKGCYAHCEAAKCANSKQYGSCIECDYMSCGVKTNNFTNPGECNLGLMNEDFVLPYCGKERFRKIQKL